MPTHPSHGSGRYEIRVKGRLDARWAVALYPVTRRVSGTAAIGFVTSRVVEATLILVGVMSLLSVVTLQDQFAGTTGAQAEALGVTGAALVAMRQWTFLLGPGLIPG